MCKMTHCPLLAFRSAMVLPFHPISCGGACQTCGPSIQALEPPERMPKFLQFAPPAMNLLTHCAACIAIAPGRQLAGFRASAGCSLGERLGKWRHGQRHACCTMDQWQIDIPNSYGPGLEDQASAGHGARGHLQVGGAAEDRQSLVKHTKRWHQTHDTHTQAVLLVTPFQCARTYTSPARLSASSTGGGTPAGALAPPAPPSWP